MLSPYTLSKEVVRHIPFYLSSISLQPIVAVAGSAVKWLRDSMQIIQSAADINTLAAREKDTGGVYFVTAFSGLLAPYWDPGAAGLLIGVSQYTNPAHIARATLEANAFQTRAIIESMKLDSGSDLKYLKVDGGMTNGDLAMEVLADIGGFSVIRPEMRECVFWLFLLTAFILIFYPPDLRLSAPRSVLVLLLSSSDGICPILRRSLRSIPRVTANLLLNFQKWTAQRGGKIGRGLWSAQEGGRRALMLRHKAAKVDADLDFGLAG